MYEAWKANDAEAFVADYLYDASVVQPAVYRTNRQEIQSSMAGAFAGPLKGSRVIDQPQDVRFLSEDTAIVISEGGIVFPPELTQSRQPVQMVGTGPHPPPSVATR